MTKGRHVTTARAPVLAALSIAAGAAVAVAIGGYGRAHAPTGVPLTTLGFPSLIAMKVWLGSAAGVLSVVQLVTALRMYGRLGRRRPAGPRTALLHRSSGTLAVLLSLPVAFQCLWSLGFGSYSTRVLLHSVVGCLFYGAFVTKLLALHLPGAPGWLLPMAGGLVLTALVTVVLLSSAWYFAAMGVP